jgi:HEAT repeat protein
MGVMKWLDGSENNEAKRWVKQLADSGKRERASNELIRMGAKAAPALVEALRDRASQLASQAESLLGQIGLPATPTLVAGLHDDDPAMRDRCAHILAQTRDLQASDALVAALQDQYYHVRQSAALALGEIGEARTLPALLRALGDPEPEVRCSALVAIGKFNDPAAFERMADLLLEDPTIEVRQAAASALGSTRLPEALPYLTVALRDSFWWFEREGTIAPLLETFLDIGQPSVTPLLEALEDKEGTVRRFAATLLGRLGDPRAIEPLGMALYDMHFEVGEAAAEALARFGEPGLKVLAEALKHPEAWLRQHAISGLAHSGDKRILPVLVNMLDDPEREVVKLVIGCLGEMGDARALPRLKEIAADRADRELSSLARAAITAIGES